MNLKKYTEMMNSKKEEMRALVSTAEAESRALTKEEQEKFDSMKAEAADLEATIERIREVDAQDLIETPAPAEKTDKDVHEFADLVRAQLRGEPMNANITRGDNGAVIPSTIANKIIDKVADISPIFNSIEKYHSKGTLAIPYVDPANDNIAVDYASEFTPLTATASKLLTTTLSEYLAGVLVLVSRSLINNTDINITNFVVDKIAQKLAIFFEHEALIGTVGKATGLSTLAASQVIETSTSGAIKMDDVIGLKDSIKTAYQGNAYFIANPATLTYLRKLKDGASRYLMNDDVTSPFGTTLLGKPVYVSDQMNEIASGDIALYYGDFTQGLAANITENFEIQTLNEAYATQHAVGFVGWTEFDIKIQNQNALAALSIKA